MPAPLDVTKVVFGAFAVPWTNRAAFARALAVPFAFVAMLGVVQTLAAEDLPQPALWGMAVLHGLVFVLFAVTCHRLVLLDPLTVSQTPVPRWTRRETRFFLKALAMWALCMGVGFAFMALFVFAAAPLLEELGPKWFTSILMPIFLLPMYYLVARLSLVLPATALDRKVGLGWAWDLSAGNSWRLFLVIGILPWVISAPSCLIDYTGPSVAATVAVTIVGAVLLVVEIAALSLAFRELTKDEPASPTPPPASPRTA
jgi:hypothetical protein